jgi:hypothetical protein
MARRENQNTWKTSSKLYETYGQTSSLDTGICRPEVRLSNPPLFVFKSLDNQENIRSRHSVDDVKIRGCAEISLMKLSEEISLCS